MAGDRPAKRVVAIGQGLPVSGGLARPVRRVEASGHPVQAFVEADGIPAKHQIDYGSALDRPALREVGPRTPLDVLSQVERLAVTVAERQPGRLSLRRREVESLRDEPGGQINLLAEPFEEAGAHCSPLIVGGGLDCLRGSLPSPFSRSIGTDGAHGSSVS